MGRIILIYGKSGSGKSRSLLNFGEEEILLVNVSKKELPFRKKFKYSLPTDDVSQIRRAVDKTLKEYGVKTAVIDDAGYIMSDMFMNGHSKPKQGASTFDLYNDIADNFWGLLRFFRDDTPSDYNAYIVMHEETNDYGDTKLRTIGKLLDQKVSIEGMSTIALRCMTEGKEHFFVTVTDGTDVSKAPEGMFAAERIDNDLKAVDTAIRAYYNDNTEEEGEKS